MEIKLNKNQISPALVQKSEKKFWKKDFRKTVSPDEKILD